MALRAYAASREAFLNYRHCPHIIKLCVALAENDKRSQVRLVRWVSINCFNSCSKTIEEDVWQPLTKILASVNPERNYCVISVLCKNWKLLLKKWWDICVIKIKKKRLKTFAHLGFEPALLKTKSFNAAYLFLCNKIVLLELPSFSVFSEF